MNVYALEALEAIRAELKELAEGKELIEAALETQGDPEGFHGKWDRLCDRLIAALGWTELAYPKDMKRWTA